MKTVAISILGTVLDRRGKGEKRWDKWRPTISMCQQEDLVIDRLLLIHEAQSRSLAKQVIEDIARVSPETEVVPFIVEFSDPWDFEQVYSQLLDVAKSYDFRPEQENYLVHITTGTHVAQICLYLLTEAGYLPGKLLQTSPGNRTQQVGQYQIIDLDLSKYDQIASRFQKEHLEGTIYLKGGIETKNAAFNQMIEQLEQVSLKSNEPILLTGPTGAGKSQLAERIFDLRKQRGKLSGQLVVVNCATLKGENAMSALFGHVKGAFTGASTARPGLLKEADGGLLFLDEIGELGLDEQAMLLRAIEDKTFMPFGSDRQVTSHFQLIAGTNRNLLKFSQQGHFREDLLARIDLWTYQLPSLKERPEDFDANIDYELEKFANRNGYLASFNKDARQHYLRFALSSDAAWSANFRDLNASIIRMATLAEGGRINLEVTKQEILRLRAKWQLDEGLTTGLDRYLPAASLNEMDLYDQLCLNQVITVCQKSKNLADAGRQLFNVSRTQKSSKNDSHRLKQILARHGINFTQLKHND